MARVFDPAGPMVNDSLANAINATNRLSKRCFKTEPYASLPEMDAALLSDRPHHLINTDGPREDEAGPVEMLYVSRGRA